MVTDIGTAPSFSVVPVFSSISFLLLWAHAALHVLRFIFFFTATSFLLPFILCYIVLYESFMCSHAISFVVPFAILIF